MGLYTRTVTLINESNVPIVLAVPPLGTTHTNTQDIKSIDILGFGEVTFVGEQKAQKTTFSTFFPSTESVFYKPLLNPLPPISNIELLKAWQKNGVTVTMVVPETLTYLECIISEFTEEERDFTNDRYFSITLIEKRNYERETSNITGLFSRF